MGSSPSINLPAQQNYSEAMADSLKAQVDLLRGTGDFSDTGGLQNLLQTYEAPLRKSTAQTDTNILKQTLLGDETQHKVVRTPDGRFGIPDGEVVMSSEGPSAGRYQMISTGQDQTGQPMLSIVDTESGGVMDSNSMLESAGLVGRWKDVYPTYDDYNPSGETWSDNAGNVYGDRASYERMVAKNEMTPTPKAKAEGYQFQAGEGGWNLDPDSSRKLMTSQFQGFNTATPTEIQQQFKFTNPNTGEPLQEGETITMREGTGMVDLLGDRRMLTDEDRRAGFDKGGNFLGLSALTEDIGAEQQTRSRERDLADVERLSGRYKDVMDKFKDEGIMNTIGEVGGSEDVFLRNLQNERAERAGGQPAQAGDPLSAVAPSATAASTTTATTAPLPGQQGLRELLTGQAIGALGEGLTDRERRNIEQASRARATTLGRTFDVGSVEDEVTAKLLEDRNRLNQNRSFAQSVLGQEGALRMQELALQKQNELDPFRAILGRSGGSTVGQAQNILGGAGYGLQSGPAYLNPQAGINYTSQAYANQAGLEAARMNASANRTAGIFGGLGSLGGGLLSNIGNWD